jgi:hypothetical protein
VGGHVQVSAIGAIIFPWGSVASGTAQNDLMTAGYFLSGDILYGVSRSVTLGAYGEVAVPAGQGDLPSFTMIAAGAMARYHVVQGLSADPWVSYGVGFRRASNGTNAFTGLDWLRVQLGTDWYPWHALGIGPLAQITLGTYFSETNASLGTASVYANFIAGGRIVFDSPGR